MKLPSFENWSNGKWSKVWQHFRKYNDLKIDVIKKCAPKFEVFNEKEKSEIF